MLSFLLEILGSLPFGTSISRAFEAIQANPRSHRAAQLRLIAASILLVSAGFLVVAAVLWRPMQKAPLVDVLGWTGVGLFVAFGFIANRYKREQQLAEQEDQLAA
jgi:hypothetical protein